MLTAARISCTNINLECKEWLSWCRSKTENCIQEKCQLSSVLSLLYKQAFAELVDQTMLSERDNMGILKHISARVQFQAGPYFQNKAGEC